MSLGRQIVSSWCLCLLVGYLHAQAGNGPSSFKKDESIAIPNLSYTFTVPDPKIDTPLNLPSSVMSGGPRCGPDGRAFLQIMASPPMYNVMQLHSITADGKVATYPIDKIVGFVSAAIIAYDPGSSMVAMLLIAAKAGDSRGLSQAYYLALFDYDGTFREAAKLDIGFNPVSVTQLTEDSFLVVGTDPEAGKPKVVLVDSRGKLLHEFDLNSIMLSNEDLTKDLDSISFGGVKPDDMPGPMKAQYVMSLFRAAHWKDHILLLLPGAGGQVISISNKFEVSSIRLRLPPNQVADSIIPAKSSWYVRTYLQGTDNKWDMFEVDPETGEATRHIETADVPASSIACPTQTGLYGLRWAEKKPFIIFGTPK